MSDYIPEYYDPMDTENVTSVICRELESWPLIPLEPELTTFDGSGLYAIYYFGDGEPLYAPLAPYKIPVYAGRSLSHDSAAGTATKTCNPLWSRVRGHGRSIKGGGLPLAEFGVRLLRMPDVPASLGENGLRVNYQPVWNTILRDFGSNEEGTETGQSARTRWDTVHPGRNRTYGKSPHNRDELVKQVKDHISRQIADFANAPWPRP